jgi:hypothetical protein
MDAAVAISLSLRQPLLVRGGMGMGSRKRAAFKPGHWVRDGHGSISKSSHVCECAFGRSDLQIADRLFCKRDGRPGTRQCCGTAGSGQCCGTAGSGQCCGTAGSGQCYRSVQRVYSDAPHQRRPSVHMQISEAGGRGAWCSRAPNAAETAVVGPHPNSASDAAAGEGARRGAPCVACAVRVAHGGTTTAQRVRFVTGLQL